MVTSHVKDLGECAKALYNFSGERDTDLGFEVGDIITNISKVGVAVFF